MFITSFNCRPMKSESLVNRCYSHKPADKAVSLISIHLSTHVSRQKQDEKGKKQSKNKKKNGGRNSGKTGKQVKT